MNIQLIIEFVVGIALMIIVHELGHFIACRLLKVEVEEFGLGLPPRAVKLFERGGTQFTLNWLPLGGFVRPKGENDPTIEGGLAAASPWVRLIVYFSGPLMNLLSAVLLFALVFSVMGKTDPERLHMVEITEVGTDSPAEGAGLRPGDILLSLNGQSVTSVDMVHDTIYAHLGEEMVFAYQRDGQEYELTLIPRLDPPPGEGAAGFMMTSPTVRISIFEAIPLGLEATVRYCRLLLDLLGNLIIGDLPAEQGRVVGFKGMYDLYSDVRSESTSLAFRLVNVFGFFATLSVSLGLLNLIPVPALDGGRILLSLPEIIIRRRVPPRFEAWLIGISFFLLIALMLFINLRDFINPVQIP